MPVTAPTSAASISATLDIQQAEIDRLHRQVEEQQAEIERLRAELAKREETR